MAVGNNSNNSGDWDDEFFLGYFELHARTDLALFHRAHVERLLKLAGEDVPPNLRTWLSVYSETADPLIKKAREKIAEAKAIAAVDYVHNL